MIVITVIEYYSHFLKEVLVIQNFIPEFDVLEQIIVFH